MTTGTRILLAAAMPLLSVVWLAPAAAQPEDGVPDVRTLAFLSGWCQRLTVAGDDRSDVCRGPLYNVTYHSGRTSFAFPSGEGEDGLMVSFSGMDERREGDRIMLRLDRITVVAGDETESTETAEGICEYGDPRSGPIRVTCAGRTRLGDFVGIFASDGKPPVAQEF